MAHRYYSIIRVKYNTYMKNCNKCNITKPYGDFAKAGHRKDGHNSTCRVCYSRYRKQHYNDNIHSEREKARIKKANRSNKVKAYEKKYHIENRGVISAKRARRRAAILNATPNWMTEEHFREIEEFYNNRPDGYHVDHIMPLQGRNSSGLHVIWNLQYLPAKENLSKGNKT